MPHTLHKVTVNKIVFAFLMTFLDSFSHHMNLPISSLAAGKHKSAALHLASIGGLQLILKMIPHSPFRFLLQYKDDLLNTITSKD